MTVQSKGCTLFCFFFNKSCNLAGTDLFSANIVI